MGRFTLSGDTLDGEFSSYLLISILLFNVNDPIEI